ncbi:hypothetical protein [Pseudomonas luteola]|uniref:hypothetical protein n=1 Tax=Pseudomonas luteola TaxID=47886 RepID=UPI001EF55F6A|nr:hypothetical protein [Pseudomonas luteola]MCG7374208.1 hypothetical protein [Pseudomonas luteola]
MAQIRNSINNDRWTEEILALLGKATDASIARRLGVSSMTVQRKREQLGIPRRQVSMVSSDRSVEFSWTAESLALLGVESDASVASKLGLNRKGVWAKRTSLGIPRCSKRSKDNDELPEELILKLGKVPDSDLAREYGVPDYALYKARKERSIAAFVRIDPAIDELKRELGTASDYTLATKYSASPSRVRSLRNALNIPPFKPSSNKLKESPNNE